MSVTSKTIIVGGIESKSGVGAPKDGKPGKPLRGDIERRLLGAE